LAVLDAWAYSLAQKFAPLEDKEGNVSWRNEGDELRFMRFMSFSGKCAAARAQFESPRYAAIAVANQGEKIPDITRVCKAWARVPAGIANARARSVAAPIANREQQKSTGGGRKCSQLFPVEHEGGVRAGSPPRRRGLCRRGSWRSPYCSSCRSPTRSRRSRGDARVRDVGVLRESLGAGETGRHRKKYPEDICEPSCFWFWCHVSPPGAR